MEIINIEARTWNALLSRVDGFVQRVEGLCKRHSDKELKEWLDNQDVCQRLGIDKRTLQNYRRRGLLPYARVEHKVLYRPEDVEKLLASSSHPANTHKP